MDVTCEKCRAEYEFDEALLGEKGTTVKCSACGHVFRVAPPRREPARATLKLRFAHDGHVEPLTSLRELQQRIRAGQVGLDDELGRDGFGFRKLRDVPELKGFFGTENPPPKATVRAGVPFTNDRLRVTETSMPPNKEPQPAKPQPANPKRTVLGMGPLNPQIPPPPRVPNVPGALPPVARGAGDPPQRPGHAPISSIPTSPNARTAAEPVPNVRAAAEPARAPVSTAPTAPGAPLVPDLGGSEAPAIARPAGNTPRTMNNPESGPVRLYLSDDEAPPERATSGSSKTWLYALLLVVLGGGGWVGINALNRAPEPASAAARVEAPAPAAAPTPVPGAAQQAADSLPPNAAAPSAPAPSAATGTSPAPSANGKDPAPAKEAAPAKEPAADKAPAKPADEAPREQAGHTGSDPKDYGGWVNRGDQLFARGDLEGARKAYEGAVALRPSGSEANAGLGFALLAAGRARESIAYFDRAADAGYADANIGLGDAYRKLGQKGSALEAYQSYLERMPNGSRARYARDQLDGLKGGQDHEPSGSSSPSGAYQPAGELTEPPPAAPAPSEPAAPSEPDPSSESQP